MKLSMIKVIQLQGTDTALYERVAPMVMNPKILSYNHGYPFKTGEKFIWFIALSDEEVIGFMPVEEKNREWVINNYYISPSGEEKVFNALLKAVCELETKGKDLSAVVQTTHKPYFSDWGFKSQKEWKIYLKMTRNFQDEPAKE